MDVKDAPVPTPSSDVPPGASPASSDTNPPGVILYSTLEASTTSA